MKDNKKELQKFSRNNIINALLKQGDWVVNDILFNLQRDGLDEAYIQLQKVDSERDKAFQEFFDWKQEMAKQYGNGQRVKLANIPNCEITKGAEFEQKYNQKCKVADLAQIKFDKIALIKE